MSAAELRVRVLDHARDLPLPAYATAGSAGLDLRAAFRLDGPTRLAGGAYGDDDWIALPPRTRAAIPTGIAVEIPPGFEGQVRTRSGRALAEGLVVLNAPGTIDSDYRGEVLVLLVNLGSEPVTIHRGDRIAQLVIAPVAHVEVVAVEALSETGRGTGGLGSTGVA